MSLKSTNGRRSAEGLTAALRRGIVALASIPILAAPAALSAQSPNEGDTPPAIVSAQDSPELYEIDAVRVEEGPSLDGVLDDAVWRDAAVIDRFIQQEPNEGADATERTEVRVLYDGASLYLGVHAFDSDPAGVVATEMRRDGSRILDEDNIQIIFDTFRDSRSAYMFVVSPLGAQLDQQVFDEGGRDRYSSASAINRDWDGVWSVATKITDDGWIAEIEIPMVTLRFPEADPQAWGMNLERNLPRSNEQVFWAPIPKPFGLTRVSLAGSLQDLRALDRGMDLRVKPYVTGGGRSQLESTVTDRSTTGDVGLDVKYGVTAGLNLDVTVNTDFAQAEVDNEQVNLTRFPLFFPEKREFFLENSGQFAVGTLSSNTSGRIADLFFSRRIGISPSREQVPILGGGRLTGKVGPNNIAVMDLQTQDVGDQPGDNFLVTRYSRDVFGSSQIGGLFINKQASSGGHYNRTYAADMSLIVTQALTIEGFVAATDTKDVTGGDFGGHLRVGWLDQSWRIYSEYTDFGNNFNPEVGFVPRVGMRRSKLHLEWNPRPDFLGIRMMDPMWNVTYITDQEGHLESRQLHHMISAYFDNGARLMFWYNDYFERLERPFTVARGVTIDPGAYNFWDFRAMFSSNPSRRFTYNLSYSPQTFYDGDRTDWSVRAGLRVTDKLATSASFSRNDVSLPAGAFKADIGSFQIDYAMSPRISLRTLTQYNSQSDQWSTSARLRYIYRPGSDLYIVYDDVQRNDPITGTPLVQPFRDRQLIVKMTYLLSM